MDISRSKYHTGRRDLEISTRHDTVRQIKLRYGIDNLFIIYLFLKILHFKRTCAGLIDVSGDMFSNVINLVIKDSATALENVSL